MENTSWEIKENGMANSVTIHEKGTPGRSIARVWKEDGGMSKAYLIKASPVLLRVCKDALISLKNALEGGSIIDVTEELEKAIDQAEGRS